MPDEKLSAFIDFGEALLKTKDLDPLYVGLYGAQLPQNQLYRYLLVYWMFYHVGVAARMSEMEGEEFWIAVQGAAENTTPPHIHDLPGDRWPRGAERRHFRGAVCVKAVQTLEKMYPRPEDAIKFLLKKKGDYAIMTAAQTWPLFGPWISFKVVDMLERVAGVDCQISKDLALYEEPYKALQILAEGTDKSPNDYWKTALDHFAMFRAPPSFDRFCDAAEVETICCKWKSSLGGHYHVGKDIAEQTEALEGWGETAGKIRDKYPLSVVDHPLNKGKKVAHKHSGDKREREEHDSPRPVGSLF